jgi:ABC-type lipoprotein export system ATPase subunit
LVVVTHDHRIYGYADWIAEMEDGVIQTLLTPDEIKKRDGH